MDIKGIYKHKACTSRHVIFTYDTTKEDTVVILNGPRDRIGHANGQFCLTSDANQ
jgi:hypothetical protein